MLALVFRITSACLLLLVAQIALSQGFSWAPSSPGKCQAVLTKTEISVQNAAIKVGFINGALRAENKWTSTWQDFGRLVVRLTLRDGHTIDLAPSLPSRNGYLVVDPLSPKLADHRVGVVVLSRLGNDS